MAHAYTPGLRVTERMKLVKERRLPLKGTVLVEKGAKVKAEDVVARTELPGNVQPIKAASILGVHQQDLREFMAKKEKEAVEKDEIIATSKSFFGLFKSHCRSPVTGTIESISDVTGQVIIREPPIPVEVDAYIDGIVAEVMKDEGVLIQAEGSFLQGIFGVGGETVGLIAVAVETADQELTADHLKPEHAGKVVIGGSLVRIPALRKAVEVGVKALVVGGLDDKDLRELLGYDLGVAITGTEEIGCTVVVTEGFGAMTMAHRTFDLLKAREGKQASVNGATQIRAGVMRPEIVIPLGDHQEIEKRGDEGVGLQVGSPIRVIRMPYFGALGEVTELPPELQKMESEAKVRVLKAKLESGDEVLLPRANVEMIES
ncbi:MAG: hypothetical protein GF346_04320 [Candidatus Eisenbacteria bacterium]|nr:hypothetical protein [Candidatus Latescibacterota bacterium]MBD3301652.1 hypothetical protein [Candidatus Eisenbacteria bacterium]